MPKEVLSMTICGKCLKIIPVVAVILLSSCSKRSRNSESIARALTHRYDNLRSGLDLQETTLTPERVRQSFGALFRRKVEGDVFAQPLIVPGVSLGGRNHTLLIAATTRNIVYAYDAEDPASDAPLWKVMLGASVAMPSPYMPFCTPACVGYKGDQKDAAHPEGWFPSDDDRRRTRNHTSANLREIGIVGTPVVDPVNKVLFLVAFVQDDDARRDQEFYDFEQCVLRTRVGPTYRHILYAIDVASGRVLRSAQISGSVPGDGSGSFQGTLTFRSRLHLQRAALLMTGGVLYIAFSGVGDVGAYHGWVFAYAADTLQQQSIFVTTPQKDPQMLNYSAGPYCGLLPDQPSEEGGIWQSGNGPAADDASNVYVSSGNGSFTLDRQGSNFGSSVIKLRLAEPHQLTAVDWFAPFWNHWAQAPDPNRSNLLQAGDADIGSSGPVLVPSLGLILAIGKQGILWLLDQADMGRFNGMGQKDMIVQSIQAAWTPNSCGGPSGAWHAPHLHGSPIFWHSNQGDLVYLWGEEDFLKAYKIQNRKIVSSPTMDNCMPNPHTIEYGVPAMKTSSAAPGGMPGGILTLSAKDTRDGIVWAARPTSGDSLFHEVAGTLEAYDASTLGAPIWSSDGVAADKVGDFARFVPPVVANGRVYLATFSGEIIVYGLH